MKLTQNYTIFKIQQKETLKALSQIHNLQIICLKKAFLCKQNTLNSK